MPSPRSNHAAAIRIIREYEPDAERVVAALVRLLTHSTAPGGNGGVATEGQGGTDTRHDSS
jgi:hypothetical protein